MTDGPHERRRIVHTIAWLTLLAVTGAAGCTPESTATPTPTAPMVQLSVAGGARDNGDGTVAVLVERDEAASAGGSLTISQVTVCNSAPVGFELRDASKSPPEVLAEADASGGFTLTTERWARICKAGDSQPVVIVALCAGGSESPVGTLTCYDLAGLHDPSGHINDQLGGDPAPCGPAAGVSAMSVELFVVSSLTPGAAGCPVAPATWSGLGSAAAGAGTSVAQVPSVLASLVPPVAVQTPKPDTSFRWDAPAGCYYVTLTSTSATGSCSWSSPVFGVTKAQPVDNLFFTRTSDTPPICTGSWTDCP